MTLLETAPGRPLHRILFSSDRLPAGLPERARRGLWHDFYSELYGPLDVRYAGDRPFFARLERTGIGGLGLVSCRSSVERFIRTPRCVAAAESDDFHLAVNAGSTPMEVQQMEREALLAPGAMALVTDARPGVFSSGADNRWLFVQIPRRRLLERDRSADDLVAVGFHRSRAVTRHLRRYLGLLLRNDALGGDSELDRHAGDTVLDLVTLLMNARRDATELAGALGLRASRLRLILAAIRAGYDDPAFSVHSAAAELGLSARYVQHLLQGTGATFSERVLELRLQKARALLEVPGASGRRIIDIALAAGFRDVSHFNRAFRRRFGDTPSAFRGRA